jgi:hypothetical protein
MQSPENGYYAMLLSLLLAGVLYSLGDVVVKKRNA